MKKNKVIIPTLAITMLLAVGSASADETAPVSDMPLDQGIVIDITDDSSSAVNSASTEVIDQAPAPEAQLTPTGGMGTTAVDSEAVANDGTVLPIDQGDVNTTEIDTGTVVETAPVVTPAQDTTVLTETQPVVETLPQTGIASNAGVAAGVLGLLAAVAYFLTRRSKEQAV